MTPKLKGSSVLNIRRFRAGDEVRIVANLGPMNHHNPGTHNDYYYEFSRGTVQYLPLGSIGKVTSVSGWKLLVKVAGFDSPVPLHPDELQYSFFGSNIDTSVARMSNNPLFEVASSAPVLIIGDQVYLPSSEKISSAQDYVRLKSKNDRMVKTLLSQPTSVESFEQLWFQQNADVLEKAKEDYLGQVLGVVNKRDVLLDFICNGMLPVLRRTFSERRFNDLYDRYSAGKNPGKGKTDSRKPALLSATAADTPPVAAAARPDVRTINVLKARLRKISKMTFPQRGYVALMRKNASPVLVGKKVRRASGSLRIPALESLLGKALCSMGVVLSGSNVYPLIRARSDFSGEYASISGRRYKLSKPIPLADFRGPYLFEVSKYLVMSALKDQRMIQKYVGSDSRLNGQYNAGSYAEQDFGFKKISETEYRVTLDVPAHVLKDPDAAKYYVFESNQIYLPICIDSIGNVTYSERVFSPYGYSHPFVVADHSVCFGDNLLSRREQFSRMSKSEHAAGLLLLARLVLLSGYIQYYSPFPLYNYRQIKYDDIRKQKLPITNINLTHKRG